MKFVPRKQLAQWYTEAYGGEWNFHADMVADAGETPLMALAKALWGNEYLKTPLPHGATMHFKISVNDSDILQEVEEEEGRCKCGRSGQEPHPCPYQVELYGEPVEPEYCTCCEDCETKCRDGI